MSGRDCIPFVPMIGAREGELSAKERAALDAHLQGCAACRAREADALALAGLVSEALLAEAAKRDFAPFVDGVMTRIQRQPSRAPRSRVLAFFAAHRRATAAALAPILAAAALIVYVRTRPAPPPQMAAAMELTTEGEATLVLETSDGPVVLLGG